MFDGRPHRARWSGRELVLPELRIHLIELPHLAIGSPPQIAVPGVSQVDMRYFIEAMGRVEARSKFVGERLVLDEAIDAGRSDAPLIEPHGVDIAAFQASDLGSDQRGAVFEVLWALLGPDLELPVMGGQRCEMRSPLAGGVTNRGMRQSAVKAKIGDLVKIPRRRMPLRPRCRLDGRGVVAGMKVRLHLSHAVQPLGKRRVRVSGEPGVAELFIVEGAKFPRQAAQRPDELEVRLDDRNDVYQLRLLRKSETTLDLALHLAERISRCQKILDQIQAARQPYKHEVADLVRDFDFTMQEITRSPDVLGIWDQVMPYRSDIRPCNRRIGHPR